jgi:hypothetical protein
MIAHDLVPLIRRGVVSGIAAREVARIACFRLASAAFCRQHGALKKRK